MKKFILLGALSVLLYSAPGYTMFRREREAFQAVLVEGTAAEREVLEAEKRLEKAQAQLQKETQHEADWDKRYWAVKRPCLAKYKEYASLYTQASDKWKQLEQLEQARAGEKQVEQAKKEWEQAHALMEQAKKEWEQAEATVAQLDAQLVPIADQLRKEKKLVQACEADVNERMRQFLAVYTQKDKAEAEREAAERSNQWALAQAGDNWKAVDKAVDEQLEAERMELQKGVELLLPQKADKALAEEAAAAQKSSRAHGAAEDPEDQAD